MASLNPVWLEDFLALAATFNFSRAAEMRATTQPAFSRRIRALEDRLGVELIDRRVQPSVLTDAGARFVNVAREQLALIERLAADARAVADARAMTLRFAARPSHRLDVDGVPVLAFSAASGLGRLIAALCGRALAKVGPRIVFTAHAATVLRGMALDGRGVAWLPRSLIEADLKARRLFLTAPTAWRIPLDSRIFRSDVAYMPAVQALRAAITSVRAAAEVPQRPSRRSRPRPPASGPDGRS